MTTTPEAVEALRLAMNRGRYSFAIGAAQEAANLLHEQGYTITRAPQMTEAELTEQWVNAPAKLADNHYPSEMARQMAIDTERYLLAKKYRG